MCVGGRAGEKRREIAIQGPWSQSGFVLHVCQEPRDAGAAPTRPRLAGRRHTARTCAGCRSPEGVHGSSQAWADDTTRRALCCPCGWAGLERNVAHAHMAPRQRVPSSISSPGRGTMRPAARNPSLRCPRRHARAPIPCPARAPAPAATKPTPLKPSKRWLRGQHAPPPPPARSAPHLQPVALDPHQVREHERHAPALALAAVHQHAAAATAAVIPGASCP